MLHRYDYGVDVFEHQISRIAFDTVFGILLSLIEIIKSEAMMAYDFPPGTHWRDSARSPRFFIVDARAAFPIFFFLMHIRVWTGILVLISAAFFGVLERYGFSLPVFFRWIRTFFAGYIKSSRPWWT
jgi:intracellular multiplication protein IcmT